MTEMNGHIRTGHSLQSNLTWPPSPQPFWQWSHIQVTKFFSTFQGIHILELVVPVPKFSRPYRMQRMVEEVCRVGFWQFDQVYTHSTITRKLIDYRVKCSFEMGRFLTGHRGGPNALVRAGSMLAFPLDALRSWSKEGVIPAHSLLVPWA
ncbi:hypothetical protein M758_3G182200 [Ceratodon purpureus]|nr:hypothetical protein M758_3G182200 [Ceratodon purpureus]